MKTVLLITLCLYSGFSQHLSLSESTDLNYKGSLEAQYWNFPLERQTFSITDVTRFAGNLDLTLQGEFPFQIRLNTRILIDLESSTYNRYELDDFYIDYFSDKYELRAGLQIFSWKRVESVSQADFLNQTDLENDLLDADKFGELSARFRYIFETDIEQTIELYYLPYFRTTTLPTGKNRYSFGQPISNEKEGFAYTATNKEWRPQFALRYQTTLFEDIDFSLFYFNGYNRFPGLLPHSSILHHQYRTVDKSGFTFQGELSHWLVKGEFVYTRYHEDVQNQRGEEIRPKYLAYTTGFEYTLYSPLVENQDMGFILELIGDTDTGTKAVELEGFRPFQNHIFTGLRYAFNTVTDRTLLLGFFIDYKNDNVIGKLEYEERIFNTFKLKLSYDYINTHSYPLSTFTDNDRFKLNLGYYF